MPFSASRFYLCLAIAATPLVAIAAEDFVTAKGKTVAMPEIAEMTCEQIENTLAKIDLTRYRENAPVNPDPADDALFAYEQDLAQALFKVCVVERQSSLRGDIPPQKQAGTQ